MSISSMAVAACLRGTLLTAHRACSTRVASTKGETVSCNIGLVQMQGRCCGLSDHRQRDIQCTRRCNLCCGDPFFVSNGHPLIPALSLAAAHHELKGF